MRWHGPNRSIEGQEVLTVEQMYRADAGAIATGVPGIVLMEHACAAVARAIRRRWSPRPTLVLCGPGNNGGDGFGVAVALRKGGWPVTVALLGDRDALKGDAALMAARWSGAISPIGPKVLSGQTLIVDAIFGAGLSRPVDGGVADLFSSLANRSAEIVAIDVPSGVDGDTGAVKGAAPAASLTVTFGRPKPGHLLMPGRGLCGELVVGDIGIPKSVIQEIAPAVRVNGPDVWRDRFPWPLPMHHKYDRGHAVVVGGATTTGAARLAARAALRVGAGLVTVAVPDDAFSIYAASLTSVMVSPLRDASDFQALLDDRRKNAFVIGPGNGVGPATCDAVLRALRVDKRCVLDADALTSFADRSEELFAAISEAGGAPGCVLTPHDGEYARLFGTSGDRIARARDAAQKSGAVVLLKGPESVIAAPDGRAAVSVNSPPTLATAGTGDVLAGFIGGLLAAGADAFDAACMASWLHGESAIEAGPGLISEDLTDYLPAVLRRLERQRSGKRHGGTT